MEVPRRPVRASASADRFSYRYDMQQKGAKQEPLRPRKLPVILDEKPQAWVSRAMLYDEGGDRTAWEELPPVQPSEPSLDELHEEIVITQAQLVEVRAVQEKDANTFYDAAAKRRAMWDVARAKFQSDLIEQQQRLNVAAKSLEEVDAEYEAEQERSRTLCEALVRQVEPLREELSAKRKDLNKLLRSRKEQGAGAAMEEAEIHRLEPQVEELQGQLAAANLRCEQREEDVTLKREAKQAFRWGSLCEVLLELEHCRALQAAEAEFSADMELGPCLNNTWVGVWS